MHQNPADGELVWLTPAKIMKLDNLLAEIEAVGPQIFDGTDQVISYVAEYAQGNQLKQIKIEEA